MRNRVMHVVFFLSYNNLSKRLKKQTKYNLLLNTIVDDFCGEKRNKWKYILFFFCLYNREHIVLFFKSRMRQVCIFPFITLFRFFIFCTLQIPPRVYLLFLKSFFCIRKEAYNFCFLTNICLFIFLRSERFLWITALLLDIIFLFVCLAISVTPFRLYINNIYLFIQLSALINYFSFFFYLIMNFAFLSL